MTFLPNEEYQSQIPALQLLINLGYTYLTPNEALIERQGKLTNVLLENILREQLKRINRIHHKGSQYLFSEENIQSAVQKLKSFKYDGLVRTNELLYDLLTLGTSQEQIVEGDVRSFDLSYIDWKHPERNIFHVVSEYSVERARTTDTNRPDIVLFVNGIPLCVIECKAPGIEVGKGVEQIIGYQQDDAIPQLFIYSQVLLSVNKNAGQYGTVGTPKKFWGIWKEKEDKEST